MFLHLHLSLLSLRLPVHIRLKDLTLSPFPFSPFLTCFSAYYRSVLPVFYFFSVFSHPRNCLSPLTPLSPPPCAYTLHSLLFLPSLSTLSVWNAPRHVICVLFQPCNILELLTPLYQSTCADTPRSLLFLLFHSTPSACTSLLLVMSVFSYFFCLLYHPCSFSCSLISVFMSKCINSPFFCYRIPLQYFNMSFSNIVVNVMLFVSSLIISASSLRHSAVFVSFFSLAVYLFCYFYVLSSSIVFSLTLHVIDVFS